MTEVLILALEEELPTSERVWGTGGWVPPEAREALDWLVLVRLLGWTPSVLGVEDRRLPGRIPDVIIVACDPHRLGEAVRRWIEFALDNAHPLLVTRVAADEGADETLHPDESDASSFVPAWDKDDLHVEARRVGGGKIVSLGFHPGVAREDHRGITASLVHLITRETEPPVAWLDLRGTVVLRMDDPGGAQNVHSRAWAYTKLGRASWSALGKDLAGRRARLSIGYTAGWVDDGDAVRGRLLVADRMVERAAGRIHPSPLVRYEDMAGNAPGTVHDYVSEYEGIRRLVKAGVASTELHGYTHIHPDTVSWARADDRYDRLSWYREFGREARETLARLHPDQHPLVVGGTALLTWFDISPTTLICPGDEWTNEVLETALDIGMSMVDSYYLAIRHDDRFCWATELCAPYLDEPDASWFRSPLPVVGYFHDEDLARNGVRWFARWADEWQRAGARSFIDLRQLAALLSAPIELDTSGDQWRLSVGSEELPIVMPVDVCLRNNTQLPRHIEVSNESRAATAELHPDDGGVASVTIPCPPTP